MAVCEQDRVPSASPLTCVFATTPRRVACLIGRRNGEEFIIRRMSGRRVSHWKTATEGPPFFDLMYDQPASADVKEGREELGIKAVRREKIALGQDGHSVMAVQAFLVAGQHAVIPDARVRLELLGK